MQTYVLAVSHAQILGNSISGGKASLSHRGHVMELFMTEECAGAEIAPHELVQLIADYCEISDQTHRFLLVTALGNSSPENIQEAFIQQGIHVKGVASTSIDLICQVITTHLGS
jgi:hypothetical protein